VASDAAARARPRQVKTDMPHPYVAFCPYLSVQRIIDFADSQLGSIESFEDRWADVKFKAQCVRFRSRGLVQLHLSSRLRSLTHNFRPFFGEALCAFSGRAVQNRSVFHIKDPHS
jgi:hypothetical protein